MAYKYHRSVIGGTFDHLHIGHKKLLDKAFALSKFMLIGLATNKLYENKLLHETIETYAEREQNLITYLQTKDLLHRTTIIPINDFYGTTLTDKSLESIIVSEETSGNAKKINKERSNIGLGELKIEIIEMLKDESGTPITSEKIRSGKINRAGFVYKNMFSKNLLLPDNERESLRKPIGTVFSNLDKLWNTYSQLYFPLIITVGDIVSESAVTTGLPVGIAVIDNKTRREQVKDNRAIADFFSNQIKSINQPGTIDNLTVVKLQSAIQEWVFHQKKQLIVVHGEEDLLALPSILLAPLQSLVIYGQFNRGVVAIVVTEAIKDQVQKMVLSFVV